MNGTTTQTKGQHPADGSDRWSVTGVDGEVVYDLLGNHLALIDADGEAADSIMGRTLARVREYAQLGDDDAVFAVLADLYNSELVGGVW